MVITFLRRIGWFTGLVLLQALILNNIHILGYATPFLYIYLILKLESSVSRNGLLLWAFFIGLAVDVFSNTPGLNAAATVALAFVRPLYLRIFTPRDSQGEIIPSSRSMGFFSFFKYLLSGVFTHHLILYCLAFFSFTDIKTIVLNVLGSTILSLICIMGVDSVRK